jgi:hypothetical protein
VCSNLLAKETVYHLTIGSWSPFTIQFALEETNFSDRANDTNQIRSRGHSDVLCIYLSLLNF